MKKLLLLLSLIFIIQVNGQTGNTCYYAIPVCGNYSIAIMSPNSSGQTPSCFSSAPQRDIFLAFTITTSGLLPWTKYGYIEIKFKDGRQIFVTSLMTDPICFPIKCTKTIFSFIPV